MSFSADRSLLDQILAPVRNATPDPETHHSRNREAQVRIFAKQLLTALNCMHERGVAHLDLRPECILLQDDHLCLADFGQSRHLLRGKSTGNIQSTPEFVSPEVALGQTVTLASDMWSVGTLIYVLLAGISPFLGDSDDETLANVITANFNLDSAELAEVSNEAKDFVQKLLLIDHNRRMTIGQALEHDWLADPSLRDAKLLTDCVREFKYQHKWLERRVFVQQTPAEQKTQTIGAPEVRRVHAEPALPQRAEPTAIYDYAQIKNSRNGGNFPAELGAALARGSLPRHVQQQILQQLNQPPPMYDPRGRQHLPSLPPGMRPEDFLAALGIDPRLADRSPERKRLEPQAKGETPSQSGRASPRRSEKTPEAEQNAPIPPIQLIRGENREIQYELATRNLSDISEENSIAGSIEERHERESRETTPHADSESMTPLASPPVAADPLDTIQRFFGDLGIPGEVLDSYNSTAVGAPIFLESLKGKQLTMQSSGTTLRPPSSKSPGSTPGTKSPVMLSPGREHSMQVVIATKYGKQRRTQALTDEISPLTPTDQNPDPSKSAKAKLRTHFDTEFDRLMDDVDRLKQRHQKEKDMMADLEKYRPKAEPEYVRPEIDIDDSPWDSNYQIGPDTLLLATRGAAFNTRVRDYRRELWGDGAPLVHQGILGYRNADISVRERRRFTDLIREDPEIAKSAGADPNPNGISTTVRRMRPELGPAVQNYVQTNADGTHSPIFIRRLRDSSLRADEDLTLECRVLANPKAEIVFLRDGLPVDDDRIRIEQNAEVCRLILQKPTFADAGLYSCLAKNDFGSEECGCRVLCGPPPERPSRPEVELASDTEAFISWESPSASTLTLTGPIYRLESRPAGEDDHFAPWTVVSEHIEAEAVLLKHLTPHGVYQFRVTARDDFGWGEVSLTSRIIRTHKRGVPKLNVEALREERRFVVAQLPQAVVGRKTGLTEIEEEMEEEEETKEEVEMSESGSISSANAEALNLSNDDPTQRFEFGRELFRGKFSLVREATDKRRNALCAMKVRPFDRTEFDLLVRSQHEAVVRLIAAHKRSNCLLLFSERLHENVFERFTSMDNYSEEQICIVLRQLSAGLQWIHFRGVLHLDVQPSNLMFVSPRSWLVKLIDFGRAVAFSGDAEITKPDIRTLNAEWAAPEFFKPEAKISPQTDVWGMGIIGFCLFSGFHPFSDEGDTVEEVRESLLTQKCDPNLIPVQATQEALRFATWALKKDPRRRITTQEALSHRFLSADPSMGRRRDAVRFPASRLIRTAARTMVRRPTQLWDNNVASFGADERRPKLSQRPNEL